MTEVSLYGVCVCVHVRIEIVRMPLWMLHTLRWFDYGSAVENKFIQIHLKYDKCSGVSQWMSCCCAAVLLHHRHKLRTNNEHLYLK